MGFIEAERQGHAAIVRINRPEKLNALNQAMRAELAAAFAAADDDPTVRAIVLTGTGRAFSVGMDVGELPATSATAVRQLQADLAFLALPERQRKPVVAAVNGMAFGGGFELALASDLIVATESAQFAAPEPRIGVVPGFAMQRLPALLGVQRARQLLLTGRRVTSAEALDWGLALSVVSSDDLVPAAVRVVDQITELAPLAVELLKTTLNRSFNAHDLAYAERANAALFGSEDALEGMAAFREKRSPQFKGR